LVIFPVACVVMIVVGVPVLYLNMVRGSLGCTREYPSYRGVAAERDTGK
jgi:hypothetical protein